MECGLAWQGDAITGGCTAVLLARANLLLAEDRDWFKAEMERFMHAASANRAEVERLNVVMTDWQDDRDALDRANARTGRFIAILKDVEARATLLERLLREALEGLDALTDDPRDPAIRTLLRQMRAAVGGGSR
jgi:hypothetical protein